MSVKKRNIVRLRRVKNITAKISTFVGRISTRIRKDERNTVSNIN